jgi:drug/metabolite transporter (DMT)-like permease
MFGRKLDLISIHGGAILRCDPRRDGILFTMPTSRSRRSTAGLLLAGSGAILFASKGLFSKALYQGGVDYQVLTLWRSLICLPLFIALGLSRGFASRKPSIKSLTLAAFAGMLCYGVGALVDFHALEIIDVSLERALLFSYPALIVAFLAIRNRRWPTTLLLTAVALTYLGILMVVGVFDALWQKNLMGSFMVLGAAGTTATYFLIGERCMPELGSSGFTVVAMTAATVFVVVQFAATRPLSALLVVEPTQWLILIALAVLCLFLPTLLQAEGIRLVGAERGALAGTIGPPAALFMGMAVLAERPTHWQVVGTAVIVIGIFVLSRERK